MTSDNAALEQHPLDTTLPSAMVDLQSNYCLVLPSHLHYASCWSRQRTAVRPDPDVYAHKTGTLCGPVNDVGMIKLFNRRGTLLMAIYIKGSDAPEEKREHAIAEIARSVLD